MHKEVGLNAGLEEPSWNYCVDGVISIVLALMALYFADLACIRLGIEVVGPSYTIFKDFSAFVLIVIVCFLVLILFLVMYYLTMVWKNHNSVKLKAATEGTILDTGDTQLPTIADVVDFQVQGMRDLIDSMSESVQDAQQLILDMVDHESMLDRVILDTSAVGLFEKLSEIEGSVEMLPDSKAEITFQCEAAGEFDITRSWCAKHCIPSDCPLNVSIMEQENITQSVGGEL